MRRAIARRVLAGALAVTGVVLGVVPAQASAAWSLNVVALGDSYGSGTGAGDYLDGTGVPNGCWRSANSYSEVLVARARTAGVPVSFTNATCSGAATADLSQTFKGQPPQLDALQPDTHLVFLTIGTSDIDFADYGLLCITADCSGPASQAEIAEMPAMAHNITTLLAQITTRSPHAHIIMTGYGRQLTPHQNTPDTPLDPICDPGLFTSQERIDGNQVASALDATLRHTARTAGARYVSPYRNNSLDLHPSFTGHSLCESTDPYYRGFDALTPGQEGPEAVLHLNETGHTTLADLILHTLFR